jgi:hypothetical protein
MTFPAALIKSMQNLLAPDFKDLGASLQGTLGSLEGLVGLFIA